MDPFKMDCVLSLDDRMEIIAKLQKLEIKYPCCSACSSGVDIAFMRNQPHEPLNKAMCLPCFLHNHTDTNQELIDRITKIGQLKGWYYD